MYLQLNTCKWGSYMFTCEQVLGYAQKTLFFRRMYQSCKTKSGMESLRSRLSFLIIIWPMVFFKLLTRIALYRKGGRGSTGNPTCVHIDYLVPTFLTVGYLQLNTCTYAVVLVTSYMWTSIGIFAWKTLFFRRVPSSDPQVTLNSRTHFCTT